ncbi:MAG: hypothetical protein WCW44_01900 [archaeon]|jgi:hypothetical protein
MPQSLDPLTHARRSANNSKLNKRINNVIDAGQQKRGFNRRYWFRIVRVPNKIDQLAKRRGWPPFLAMQKKAVLTSRMLAYYTDHMVTATKLAYKSAGESMTIKEEQTLWENVFDGALQRYRTDPIKLPLEEIKKLTENKKYIDLEGMPERDSIMHLMRHIPDLISPPARILRQRAVEFRKRPTHIQRIIETLKKQTQKELQDNLGKELDTLLKRNIPEKEQASKVCFAASIYADALERKARPPGEKANNWSYYYAEGMFYVFDKINQTHPEIIDIIQSLK